MKKTIVYVVVLVVVSLTAGVFLGAALSKRQGQREYARIPGSFTQGKALKQGVKPLERLSKALDLNEEQKVKIADILKESRKEVMEVKEKTKETFKEIKKRADAKIREVLTVQQQEKFDKIESKLQEKIKERMERRQNQKNN